MRLLSAVLLLLGLAVPTAAPPAAAQQAVPWTVDHGQSRLGFLFTQSGSQYQGSFSDWTADIVFDREDLANSSIAITIGMGSVTTGSDDRDGLLRSSMLFDTFTFPEARFLAEELVATGENSFEARGQLTIRDVTRDVVLPFTLSEVQDAAEAVRAEGRLDINRLDYGVGQGQWQDTSMVADAVAVVFEVLATRAGGQ